MAVTRVPEMLMRKAGSKAFSKAANSVLAAYPKVENPTFACSIFADSVFPAGCRKAPSGNMLTKPLKISSARLAF